MSLWVTAWIPRMTDAQGPTEEQSTHAPSRIIWTRNNRSFFNVVAKQYDVFFSLFIDSPLVKMFFLHTHPTDVQGAAWTFCITLCRSGFRRAWIHTDFHRITEIIQIFFRMIQEPKKGGLRELQIQNISSGSMTWTNLEGCAFSTRCFENRSPF